MLSLNALTELVGSDLDAAYQVVDKQERVASVNALRDRAVAELASEEEEGPSEEDLKDAFKKLEKNIVRGRIIRGEPRIDGRTPKQFALSMWKLVCWPRYTVLHCSPVVKPRQWLLQPWVQPAMRR